MRIQDESIRSPRLQSVPPSSPPLPLAARMTAHGTAKTIVALSIMSSLMTGCASAPSINVWGAYFPDWMFCIVGALVLTLIVRAALLATGWIGGLARSMQALFYPALTAVLAFAGWLLFFQN